MQQALWFVILSLNYLHVKIRHRNMHTDNSPERIKKMAKQKCIMGNDIYRS